MKKTIFAIFILVTLVLAFSSVNAQDIKEVMIATNISYADFAVASVAASKIGAALFFVSKGTIPSDTLEAINSINPDKIYIIGGPAVVSRSVELELNKTYQVIRIWGMTRYGTSCEVAKYFWPEGSEKAVLVWDLPDSLFVNLSVSSMIVKSADEAQAEGIPLILIPKNHLTVEIEDTLKTLNVSSVKLYGDVGSKVIDDLNSLGIEIKERITGNPSQVRERLEEKDKNMFKNETRPLVIAAVANWEEGIAVRAAPHGVSILVFSESEIPRVVNKTKEIISTRNVSKILVTGKPDLSKKIYDALIDAGINETTPVIWVTGKHYEIARKIFQHVKERLKEIRERHERILEKIRKRLIKLREKTEDRCEYWLFEANKTIETLNTSVAKARYNLIQELYNSCVDAVNKNQTLVALRCLNNMKNEVRRLKWENRATKRSLIQEEIQTESEAASETREKERSEWKNFEQRMSQKLLPAKVSECKSLIESLRNAIAQRNYDEARRIKFMVSQKCAQVTVSREGGFVPVKTVARAKIFGGR